MCAFAYFMLQRHAFKPISKAQTKKVSLGMTSATNQNHIAQGPAMDMRDYAAALKHSRRVRGLKLLLPLATIVIGGGFVAASFLRASLFENVTIESAKIENGKIVMEKPALSGRNDDGVAYMLQATRALQDIVSPNLITLESIAAQLPGQDGLMANIRAAIGEFDRDTEKLELTKPFDIDLSNGVNAHFRSASVELANGKLTSDKPVSITMPDTSIVANRFVMKDNGGSLIFEGAVKILLNPAVLKKEEE